MPQLRSILSIPAMYILFGWLIGSNSGRAAFVREYIRPKLGESILDIGCGPGDIVSHLPLGVEYVGFDASQPYIDAAKKRFGGRATFICERVNTAALEQRFDVVLALGILHHLNDAEALQLFRLAQSALKPEGRLITLDGVYTNDQSRLVRWIISKDRGQYVRDQEGYHSLANQVFKNTKVMIRHDLLRIPYTHIIMECQ